MEEGFKIYVDRLRDGQVEKIDEKFEPTFIDVNEPELAYKLPVSVRGEAYLTDKDLILHLAIDTKATLLCSICNQPVDVVVSCQDHYHVVPLNEIKSGIYIMKDTLRETIILETPKFAECNNGKCPKRSEYKAYLKKEEDEASEYHPFADLNEDRINGETKRS